MQESSTAIFELGYRWTLGQSGRWTRCQERLDRWTVALDSGGADGLSCFSLQFLFGEGFRRAVAMVALVGSGVAPEEGTHFG